MWIAALVGAAAGAGFNGLLLIYAALSITVGRGPGGRWLDTFVTCNAGGILVMGSTVAVLIWAGRRFRRLSGGVQRSFTAIVWLMALVDLLIFFSAIR
jgi:hypothetical protein